MNDRSNDQPFFIGWESKPAAAIGDFLRSRAIAVITLGVVIAATVTAMQQAITTRTFDFGNVKDFAGLLVKSPVPMLIADGGQVYYLVAPLKNGFSEDTAAKFHLQHVKLKGTLIGDDLDSMIEVAPDSVLLDGGSAAPLMETAATNVTVRGEIVDSKCYLGVMNPGRYKPHRACAIQCIKGGIPPVLVARAVNGSLAHYVLVGADGAATNEAVLPYVAEPVEISGALKVIAGRNVLYINPQTITRL